MARQFAPQLPRGDLEDGLPTIRVKWIQNTLRR
jgi:hypothetical protein